MVEPTREFEPFDCIPSDRAKRFRRNLLQHGSKADKFGYTLADCFLRRDQGAVVRGTDVFDQAGTYVDPVLSPTAGRGTAVMRDAALAGVAYVPAAGGAAVVLVPPAATPGARDKQDERATAHKMRVADSAAFLIRHISDESTLTLLDADPYRQNGPEMFDYVMSNCLVPVLATGLQDLKTRFWAVSIISHIGISEATISLLLKELRLING